MAATAELMTSSIKVKPDTSRLVFVPQGHPIIAQRFNAGLPVRHNASPAGTTEFVGRTADCLNPQRLEYLAALRVGTTRAPMNSAVPAGLEDFPPPTQR